MAFTPRTLIPIFVLLSYHKPPTTVRKRCVSFFKVVRYFALTVALSYYYASYHSSPTSRQPGSSQPGWASSLKRERGGPWCYSRTGQRQRRHGHGQGKGRWYCRRKAPQVSSVLTTTLSSTAYYLFAIVNTSRTAGRFSETILYVSVSFYGFWEDETTTC